MDAWLAAIHYTVFNLARALLAPLQYDSFLYWPHLLTPLALALVLAWRGRRGVWRPQAAQLFSRALWWHRSARADYRLYFANALILPGLFALMLPDHTQVAAALRAWVGAGTAAAVDAPGWMAAYTLVFFVAYDAGRYVAHSLLHRVPLLWEFHKVHHSAEVLTPLTSYRAHPLDLLVMGWGSLAFTVPVHLLFVALAGGQVPFVLFMGLHVLLFLCNQVGNLYHSPVWLDYGPRWGRWLISPAHHQIHHSRHPAHWGKNLGFALAVWDRWGGTLYVPAAQEAAFDLGLEADADPRWQSLRYCLLAPFGAALRLLRREFSGRRSRP